VFVALVIQRAVRMRRIVLSSVDCLAVPHYSTLSHKGKDLQKKKTLLNIMCVFDFLYNFFSNTFLIPRRNEGNVIINVFRSSCTVPVIVVRF